MTKTDLIDAVAEKTGLTKRIQARLLMQCLIPLLSF